MLAGTLPSMNLIRLALLSAALAGTSLAATGPGSFRVDAPMKMIKTELPVFPQSALVKGLRHGEARVAIAVDATGRLTDYLVLYYTFSSFADAAITAVKTWRFEPMRIGGISRASVANLKFTFEAEGAITNLDIMANEAEFFKSIDLDPVAFSACMPRDLDRIPTPIKIVQPVLPDEPGRSAQRGQVTVKFFIDDHGRVRLPRVSSVSRAANEELAASAMVDAAVAAVAQWQFEPPLSKGKPTIVLVAQDLDFPPVAP